MVEEIEIPVKERPVLFSEPMVKAILNGRKTQTRRVVKHVVGEFAALNGYGDAVFRNENGRSYHVMKNLYGNPGDRLRVRESGWERPDRTLKMIRDGADTWPPFLYSADGEDEWAKDHAWIRRPSIHMPRRAWRITLEITDVRVERLQDVSEPDAEAEGVTCHDNRTFEDPAAYSPLPSEQFAMMWDKINGKKYPWNSNPWVWVITFKRVEV